MNIRQWGAACYLLVVGSCYKLQELQQEGIQVLNDLQAVIVKLSFVKYNFSCVLSVLTVK